MSTEEQANYDCSADAELSVDANSLVTNAAESSSSSSSSSLEVVDLPTAAEDPELSRQNSVQYYFTLRRITSADNLRYYPAWENEPGNYGIPNSLSNGPPIIDSGSAKRLRKELREMIRNPPPNCSAGPMNDNLYEWVATIIGPDGTVFEGGTFSLNIRFTQQYPYQAPLVRFVTRVYHCNISTSGSICLDILKENWSPVLTVAKVLLSICSLLTDCNPNDPLMPDIAEQYLHARDEYNKTARLYTKRYASG